MIAGVIVDFAVLRAAARTAEPWKNGGGRTWQVDAAPLPDGTFGWRVSIAEIASSGPFSSFPGVARVITVIDGPGITLTVDGVQRELGLLDPFPFSGDAAVDCAVTGTTYDLNLMTTVGSGSVEILRPSGEQPGLVNSTPGETVLVLALTDQVDCDLPGDAIQLTRHDAVRFRDGAAGIVTGGAGAVAAVLRIRP